MYYEYKAVFENLDAFERMKEKKKVTVSFDVTSEIISLGRVCTIRYVHVFVVRDGCGRTFGHRRASSANTILLLVL